MPLIRTALTSAALAAAARSGVPAEAVAQQPGVVLVDTAVLQAPQLDESSGIVASRRRSGVFWSVNDSGNDAVLFATDSAGSNLGFVRVLGAQNQDWEDLSIGPCPRTPGTCLFIADTGDNGFRRPQVVVYAVPEVDPPTGPADTTRSVLIEEAITLRFPDRPHDAEGLVVTDRWLMLVTKDRTGPALLFRAPRQAVGARVLEHVTDLAMQTNILRGRIATGAALSRDGQLLAVRTYTSLHLFALRDGVPEPLTDLEGITIPVVETQGEGIAFDHVGRLVLSSERGPRGHAIMTRLRLTGLDSR